MGYEIALDKAWGSLAKQGLKEPVSVRFLADEYTVNLTQRRVLSVSCNAAAKDFTVILLLHYLIRSLQGLPEPIGEWQDFKELSGVEGYASAFRKRAIEPIIRKYGKSPEGILAVLERMPGRRTDQADVSVVLDVFEKVQALVTLWRPDEEFGPEANILFDKNITQIFCTEDIVVLAGMIAASL